MKTAKSFFKNCRRKKPEEPLIKRKANSERDQYERQLAIQLVIKDYTGEKLVTREILNTAYEKMQLGKLDKYLSKKFPDREIKTNVTRTQYQVSGVVCIR